MRRIGMTLELLGSGNSAAFPSDGITDGSELNASTNLTDETVAFKYECEAINVVNLSSSDLSIVFYIGSQINGKQVIPANTAWSGNRSFTSIKLTCVAIEASESIYITGEAY